MDANPLELQNYLFGGGSVLVFFLGIVIRKVALSGPDGPPLHHQLLLGIPIALAVIPPLVSVLTSTASNGNTSAVFITMGIIMEHGMIVPEAAVDRIRQRIAEQ